MIQVRSIATGSTPGGSGGTASATIAASTQVGDVLLAFMGRDDAHTSQAPTTGSWTSRGSVFYSTNSVALEVFTMTVTSAGSASYQHPDTSASDKIMQIVVLSGALATPDSLTTTGSDPVGASGVYTINGTSPAVSNDLLLGCWLLDIGDPTFAGPAGYVSSQNNNNFLRMLVSYKRLSASGATGSIAASDTNNTTRGFVGVSVTMSSFSTLPISWFGV